MEMRNCIKPAVLLLGLITGMATQAQTDPHFSQYYAYPMWLNPALTGAMDGDYRVAAVYRNQWGNIANSFTTPGVSADFVTNKNVNLGVNIMNQRTNTGGYNYLTAYGTMSYTGVRFGDHQVAMGMALGVINRRFDPSKFTMGDQWNPVTGVGGGGSTEVLNKTSALGFDAGAGIMYFDAGAGKKANLFLGFSAFHLTQPQDPFITGGNADRMPIRYTGHGGVKLNVSEGVSFTPNILYMRQGSAEEKMVGAYSQLRVNESTDFIVGLNYRVKDAVSPYAGIYYKNFVIGASYDVNSSELSKVTGNANSFELSLTFIGSRRANTDAVPFVTPRF
jgi:type IX secretion system PorP/SprF family membrane protein